MVLLFFFFKQKTAYEMRISDWSADVCSSDLGWLGVILTAWCTYFFRDPARITPVRDGLLISPADGAVQMIERSVPPEELGMGGDALLRISVFMIVFNVHVNRSPVDATVTALAYRPGTFLNAPLATVRASCRERVGRTVN